MTASTAFEQAMEQMRDKRIGQRDPVHPTRCVLRCYACGRLSDQLPEGADPAAWVTRLHFVVVPEREGDNLKCGGCALFGWETVTRVEPARDA